jgi:hypothetical protein
MKIRLACCIFVATITGAFAQNIVTTTADSGTGSLRQVILAAASGSTITFDSSLSGQTITLTGGELLLNQSLTIDGSALPNGVTISGNNSSRVFETSSGTTCVFTRLTITNGFNSGLGGAVLNGGTLTVNQCTIAASSAGGAGGGVFSNGGAATLNATTLSANSALFGGGIANNGGPLTLNQCTLSGNSATGNANSAGGAISNGGGTATVTQCTISGNSVSGTTSHGGGIDNGGTLTLSNTIVANNTGPTNPNVAGAFTDNGGNLTSGNPVLAPLGNNGGPTQTMLPQTGSPAIDGGNDAAAASFTYDQRGPGFPRILGTHVDIGAIETAGPATVVVMNNADSGNGSLRYAISHAIMGSTITFDSSLSGQTITLTSGELLLSQNLTIDASALASGITISGNSSSRVFETNGGTTCVLTRLTITNGFNSGLGGAILNAGTLTVNQCGIAASSAGTAGAGIFNNGGTLTFNGSTLSGNSSLFGGAMANNGGVVTLNQSTFSSNSVTGSNSAGGAISNGSGTVTLVQCTLSANSANGPGNHGGGIDSSGTLILSNTIVAANSATTNPNIAGSFTDNGGNLISGNPALSALGNYGGPTQTMPPLAGSPAIDAGNDAAAASFTYDQRGVGYPRSLGSHVDIGAVESNLPGNFVVLNNADSGSGSLRYALAHAIAGSTITFDASLSGQTITLTSGELLVNQNLVVDASALTNGITISGNHNSRVLEFASGITSALTALTIANGNNSNGGGVLNGGTLTINRCTLSGNAAIFGGAISNGGTLALNQCTLSGNSVTSNNNNAGGAISNGGTLALNQCTVSGNSANGSTAGSGGIDNGGGTMTLSNSIVAGNTAAGSNTNTGGSFTDNGGNLLFGNPTLSALGNYGGPTQTMPPLAGSPAIDAGNDTLAASFTTDQRGSGYPRMLGLHVDSGAIEVNFPENIVISSNADSGANSLRYALVHATLGSTFTFAAGLSGQTITLTTGELVVNQNLILDASPLPNGLTISGNNNSRIFNVSSGTNCTLTALNLTHGTSGTTGGAILNSGTLAMNRCTLSGSAAATKGGAIYNSTGSTLSLTQCTISGNSLTGNGSNAGAGISNAGSLTLSQCTVSANSANGSGGSGGGIENGGNLTLGNTIVAANTATTNPNIAGAFTDSGGNITSGNPVLSALGNYGGPTQTMSPLADSPAIDAGNDAADASFPYDQRGAGYPRFVGLHVDTGAVEVNLPENIVISSNADSGAASLRYAVVHATTGSTITFDISLSGQTIALTTGELLPNSDLTVDASVLPNGLTISGNHNSRVFHVNAGTTCVLSALTIANGSNPSGGGISNAGTLTLNQCKVLSNSAATGGGIVNTGTLTLSQCTLSSNSTDGSADLSGGGAIYNSSGGALTLNQSTLSANAAGVRNYGGAILNDHSTMTLKQCTLSGNSSNYPGGAISTSGTATLTQCTISNNASTDNSNTGRGGGIDASGSVILRNSIVAGNTAPGGDPNIFGFFGDNGGNFTSGNPMLLALGSYGGPTQTMALLAGSPAIDAGDDTAAFSFANDQRGSRFPRVVGAHVDIGAYERGTLNNFNAWSAETLGLAAGALSFTDVAPNRGTYGLNYALRANPSSGSASLLPALSSSGTGHILQFPYRAGATDLIYTAQRSSDLAIWTEIYRFNPATNLVAVNGVTSSEDAINQIITINDPATGQKLFWRVSILQAP